ncbi:MAG: tRNA (adenosine(37)-N6)-threonylcarbamoyltransferase complex transferase subunit TsaD [Rhodocyclaceae bacterium]|nr:tRNA (adenosine(37)-N6)-threonylcarbamoyltransferase complex transferase subunit TsaD [Rhodocyclaceae bacterium]
MIVLGIESSCDETGVALYDRDRGLLAHRLHSQVALHAEYGGVVPELASRDHIRRLPQLIAQVLADAGIARRDLGAIGYTSGPGLAGALLVGASVAVSMAFALDIPALPIHHLEGHLLSPMLSADAPAFPFVALLVSGGHTQLMRVEGVGCYRLLGESVDDAAGEAFDKTAKLLGLGYPGGPELARLAETGIPGRIPLPRPMLKADHLDFSFSGLKTAVLTAYNNGNRTEGGRADLAAEFQQAVVDVLVAKSIKAVERSGLETLVVAGGVGANRHLRGALDEACRQRGWRACYPEPELCTDNGAMIAFAASLRVTAGLAGPSDQSIVVRPRWPLEDDRVQSAWG